MAVLNPVTATDLYGERRTAWTDGVHVYICSNLFPTPILVVNQPTADSPIALTVNPAGLLTITYLAADGSRLTKSSQRDGDSGTWS